jgi:hypothetical protein
MDASGTISLNPLFINSIRSVPERPAWLCKHSDSVVVNAAKRIYRCARCNSRKPLFRMVKQSTMIGVLQNGELPPSPT